MGMSDAERMDCFDKAKSAKLGYKVCKTGLQHCQAPVLFVIPAMSPPITLSRDSHLAIHQPSAPRANAESFWRPPRL